MRIVVIGHSAQLSGGELAMLRCLAPLQDQVDVHVILAEDGPLVTRLSKAGVSVEVLPFPESGRALRKERVTVAGAPLAGMTMAIIYTVRIAFRLRRLRPDLVHTNTLKSALYGGVGARLVGVPVLWHIRDRIAPDYLPPTAVRLVQAAARVLPCHVIANSETTRSTLKLPRSRSSVIPSAVESPRERQTNRVGSGTVFVMVGRIAPWKGQDVFVKAFAEAFPAGTEMASIVGAPLFGEDEYACSLVDLVERLGVSDRVIFRGFREDVASELDTADVLVHASTTPEPFGQVVIQGMAAGLAVIASDAGGPAEIVEHFRNGILVRPGDVGALASIMRLLAKDPMLRKSLGDRGRTTALNYSPEVVTARMLDVYRSIVGR